MKLSESEVGDAGRGVRRLHRSRGGRAVARRVGAAEPQPAG